MTIKLRYLLLLLCIGPWVQGQVKIGDNPQDLDPASILELESTSRALVISRMTTAQMNAITPLKGAMIYNIDVDCLYYYDGSNWINLCEASGGPFTFTTDPVVNTGSSSIIITQMGNNYNIEVLEITGRNITEKTILRNNLGDGIVDGLKLADNAVISGKIGTGAVGSEEIDNESIQTVDIASGGPDKVLSTDSNGAVQWQDKGSLAAVTDKTITGAGTVGNPLKVSVDLTTAIAKNTTDIADHIAVDGDTDSNNELQTLSEVLAQGAAANGRITDLNDPTGPQDAATRAYVDSVVGADTNTTNVSLSQDGTNLNLTDSDGNTLSVLLSDLNNGTDTNTTNISLTQDGTNLILTDSDGSTVSIALSDLNAGSVTNTTNASLTRSGAGTEADPYTLGVADNGITSLQLADDAVTTTNILDANVTPAKIEPSETVGQVLTSTATGTAWATPVAAVNPIFARGKVAAIGGIDGAYTISFPTQMPNTDYIIQTTVVENTPTPLIIKVTEQTMEGFSVQIYEFDGSVFIGANADWFYTILNP